MWAKIVIIFLILYSTEKLSAELSLIYPTPSDSIECGTTINIKWINTSSKPIDLYYSLDSLNWILIQKNISGNNYDWLVPTSLHSLVYFKLFRPGNSGVELIWDMKDAHSNWVQVSKFIDDNRIVTVGRDNFVKVWDIPTRSLFKTTSFTGNQATNFAIGYDKDKVIIAQDMIISTWDLATGNTKRIYVNPKLETARVIDYDPNNQEVAIGSKSGFVQIIDLFGAEMARFDVPNINTIYSLDYSSDGRYLAVAGDDGYVYIINLESEEIKQSEYHHGDTQNLTIWSVEISNDLKYVLSGGVDDTAVLWDFATLDTIKTFKQSADIRSTRFSQNSNLYLISGLAKSIEQYKISTLNNDGSTINHAEQVLWAEYLNNGDTLVSAGRDNSFKVWKNSHTDDDIAFGLSNLYQEMEINFPEIYVNLSEKFDIPIEFKGNFDLLDSISVKYSMPIDLVELDGYNEIKAVNRDEEFYRLFIKGNLISQVLHNGTSLLSNRKRGDLFITEVKFYPEGNYRVNTDDGFIEIIDTCDLDTSRFVLIEKSGTNVEIQGKIINEILEYELNTIVDANFEISIYDINGNKVMILDNSFFKNGNYLLANDVSFLSAGTYFLVTKFDDKMLNTKFIKL